MFTVAVSKGEEDSDWAFLPEHLLEAVLNRLRLASDYVRFAVVCKHWLSAAQFHHKKWLKSSPKQLPVLLIYNSITSKHTLHRVVGKNLVLTKDNLLVPNYSDIYCCGSSHGWLISIRHKTLDLILINPFTRATIHLPPITKVNREEPNMTGYFRSWRMHTPTEPMFILSEDPSLHPDTYQVLAIHSINFMCLLTPGSETWDHILQPFSFSNVDIHIGSHVYDAIYYQGKFYITGWDRKRWFLTVETIESPSVPLRPSLTFRMTFRKLLFGQEQELPENESQWFKPKRYLVESCKGYLLYVERSYINVERSYINGRIENDELLSDFRVYKIDLSGVDETFTLLPSLGGESLFLGFNQSMSVLASEFPDCQPECIYNAYNFIYHGAAPFGARIGVYDLVNPRDNKPDHIKICDLACRNELPPVWIIPRCNFVDED